jgi:hypothetical protein
VSQVCRYINGRKWVCDIPGGTWLADDWEVSVSDGREWWLFGRNEWVGIEVSLNTRKLGKALRTAEDRIAELIYEREVREARQAEQDAMVDRIRAATNWSCS